MPLERLQDVVYERPERGLKVDLIAIATCCVDAFACAQIRASEVSTPFGERCVGN